MQNLNQTANENISTESFWRQLKIIRISFQIRGFWNSYSKQSFSHTAKTLGHIHLKKDLRKCKKLCSIKSKRKVF